MIWKNCVLLVKEQVETDALGNPIYEYRDAKEVKARFAPWTDDQVALEGRDVTKNEQQYILPIPFSDFPRGCDRVRMEGRELLVTQVSELSPRWTMLRVKIYKEPGYENS